MSGRAAREAPVAEALGRAALYGLLATAFDAPTPERLRLLCARAGAVLAAPGTPAAVRERVARLAEAAAAAGADALAAEHAALFEGAVRCPPYGSAWGPQQVSGKAAQLADVAGFYVAFGLAPTAWNAELEDHVAAECEFLATLALREAHALSAGLSDALEVTRAAATAFLRDHLGRWAGAFAAEVAAQAGEPLYKEAAALLEGWVEADARRLGAAPVRVEGLTPAEAAPFSCPQAVEAPD